MLNYFFIFQLCGLALISVGTIALSQYETIKTEAEGGIITGAAISLIIIGLIIFIISFLGCCGAIKESYCMTTSVSYYLFENINENMYFLVYFVAIFTFTRPIFIL